MGRDRENPGGKAEIKLLPLNPDFKLAGIGKSGIPIRPGSWESGFPVSWFGRYPTGFHPMPEWASGFLGLNCTSAVDVVRAQIHECTGRYRLGVRVIIDGCRYRLGVRVDACQEAEGSESRREQYPSVPSRQLETWKSIVLVPVKWKRRQSSRCTADATASS